MEGVHIGIYFHTKDTKNKAIKKLLDVLYKILENYDYEIEDYEFKKIEIKENKFDGDKCIDFRLYGENEKKKEYLDIDITIWYKERYEEVKNENRSKH